MSQEADQNNLLALLKSEFERRRGRNRSYSLRAFSRDLQVEPSALSKWLRSKRTPDSKSWTRVLKNMGFLEWQKVANQLHAPQEKFRAIEIDSFLAVSDWASFALLELTATSNFKPDLKFVSKRLGLKLAQVKTTFQSLLQTGLLKIETDGSWTDTAQKLSTLSIGASHFALRKLQTEILSKAIDALENLDPALRDQSTVTMAIDVSKLPEAKERIKAFRRNLMLFLEDSNDRTEVYALAVSLFPLSR